MPDNAFIGKPEAPTDQELAAQLGPAKALWEELADGLARDIEIDVREWNSYSRKAGWSLRLKRGKRAIVYLSPCRGCFLASFALGDKAVQAARASGLPRKVLAIFDQARRYAEGTGIRIEVRTSKDAEIVKKLAAIKLAN